MKRVWQTGAKILTGLFVTAVCAMPQAYTISARPGVVNYMEGNASINGQQIQAKQQKSIFLNANDVLSTDVGKAEVLLTPGVFLRIGDNSQIRMISPSLTDAQVELDRGEAMLEVDELVKDNRITITNHGGSLVVQKTGLYRLTAGDQPTAATLEGKAEIYFGDDHIELNKGHETVLAAQLRAQKFDAKREDDLYAWSNTRSEYNAAASYQTAKNVSVGSYNGGWWDYGFGGWAAPGWYWNSAFNSYAWLPMNAAFFSPFGYGFYGPGLIGYAPVITAPIYYGGGGGYQNWQNWKKTHPGTTTAPVKGAQVAAVPVNPNRPPALGFTASPAAAAAARSQMSRSFASQGGFQTITGAPAARFEGAPISGGGVRMGSSGPSAAVHSSGPSFSGGGHASGGFSGTGMSAGHAAGGGGHK
ncbi:MAG: FecR domain-containing protein [Acidobacteriaceae bacterium]|nr:FecR domain-containing protein [Acidobacteriaceae bacterium]MBV9499802.1 FecR domain-containing protein [Acidobacteriaceae bacterium]